MSRPNPPRAGLHRLLAVGAVIVPEAAVAGYTADLAAIRTDLEVPPGEELKWKPSKGSFLASAGRGAQPTMRTRMLEAAIARQIRTVVVIRTSACPGPEPRSGKSYSATSTSGSRCTWTPTTTLAS